MTMSACIERSKQLKQWLQKCLETFGQDQPQNYGLDLYAEWIPILKTLNQYLQTPEQDLLPLCTGSEPDSPSRRILFVPANTVPISPVTMMSQAILQSASLTCRIPGHLPFVLYEKFLQLLPETAPRMQLVQWDSRDLALGSSYLRQYDKVIAHGSDQTIQSIADLIAPEQTFFGYGHKFSILVLKDPGSVLEEMYQDLLAYRQLGCLSPHIIFLLGRSSADLPKDAQLLAQRMRDYPRLPGEAFQVRSWIEREVWKNPQLKGLDDHILLGESTLQMPPPGLGIVMMQGLSSLTNLRQISGFCQDQLLCIGHDLAPTEVSDLARAFPDIRLCPVGEMQYPPLNWFQRPTLKLSPQQNPFSALGDTISKT